MLRALVLDDDRETREALAELAAGAGFEVETAGTLAEARTRLASATPDVILTDLRLPDGSGLDLLQGFDGPDRPELVLITGHATVDSAVAALRSGASDYLTKPVDVARLTTILANLSRTLALKDEVRRLRGELRDLGRFGPMIGASPPMQRVYDLITRVAATEFTVLVTGESGTGKELVARTLHDLGARRNGPFVAVNCGAVPANLIESELFGHERGAFTGATQQHRGMFERASGGTLFLDEIVEMPLELQPRLLRVLETGALVRVGGEEPVPVDARLVAATNRSPEAAVREGRLREDLYYRLHVFPVALPPLRERGADVALIAQHVLDGLNREAGTAKVFSDRARAALERHRWPGNVRELRNAIQRGFVLAEDAVDLDVPLPVAAGVPAPAGAAGVEAVHIGLTLEEVERRLILATLEHCGGDKRKAAATLGISLKTLYNRINLYAAREGAAGHR